MIELTDALVRSWCDEFEELVGTPMVFQDYQCAKRAILLSFVFTSDSPLTSCSTGENGHLPVALKIVLKAQDEILSQTGERVYFLGMQAVSFFNKKYGILGRVENSLDAIDSVHPELISQDFGFNLAQMFYVDLTKDQPQEH